MSLLDDVRSFWAQEEALIQSGRREPDDAWNRLHDYLEMLSAQETPAKWSAKIGERSDDLPKAELRCGANGCLHGFRDAVSDGVAK